MKRVLAVTLMLAMILTMIPLSASASDGKKLIALTFDDGPDRWDTPVLLDGLKERGVKVTFFVQGERVDWYPHVLKRAYNEGHEIGCHSWDHPDLTELTTEQVKDQFARSYAVMDEICGQGTDYLVRPPYGSTNEGVREAIDRPLIHWNVDTLDWELLNSYKVRDAVIRDAADGAIVLLHDIHRTSVDGVLMAIDVLLEQDYEFVTVSELFRRRGTELENGKRYYSCKPNGKDLGPIATPEITCTATGAVMEITITSTSDAPVYYTTDGSIPNGDSMLYAGPFVVEEPCQIRAVAAYRLNGSRSSVASFDPGQYPCDMPEARIENGMLVLTHPMEEMPIHYTLDGTKATLESPHYTGPIAIPAGCRIHAVAGGGDFLPSEQMVYYCSRRGILSVDLDPGAWYFESMDELAGLGLMNGVGGHRFAPQSELTRGMLVTLLYRCSGETLGQWIQTSAFTDVESSAYYAEAVEWAYRSHIVNGYSEQIFKPNGPVTREELCRIIDGYLSHRGTPLAPAESCEDLYPDYDQIQPWASASVDAMTAAGLIRGDGTGMNPRGTANRAQVAAILVRMLDYEQSTGDAPETTDPIETTEPTVTPEES